MFAGGGAEIETEEVERREGEPLLGTGTPER